MVHRLNCVHKLNVYTVCIVICTHFNGMFTVAGFALFCDVHQVIFSLSLSSWVSSFLSPYLLLPSLSLFSGDWSWDFQTYWLTECEAKSKFKECPSGKEAIRTNHCEGHVRSKNCCSCNCRRQHSQVSTSQLGMRWAYATNMYHVMSCTRIMGNMSRLQLALNSPTTIEYQLEDKGAGLLAVSVLPCSNHY